MRLIDGDALLQKLNNEKVPFNAYVNNFIMNAPTVNQWISACDYLPEHGEKVVVRFSNGQMSVNLFCRFEEHNYWLPDLPDAIRRPMQLDKLDWWMPIPEWNGDE